MNSTIRRNIRLLIAILVILVAPGFLEAASGGCDGNNNCYVYGSASGSGSGANWTNACKSFTGNCSLSASGARGVTFWVAAGNYGGITISSPTNGTTPLTIEAATATSNGSASDWNPAFAGQAIFAESGCNTGYVTIEGQTRGSDWQSGYNIKFWNQTDGAGAAVDLNQGCNNFKLDNAEVMGTNTAGTQYSDNGILQNASPLSNIYVGHSWVHNTGNTQFQINAGDGSGGNTGFTSEYNYISFNHQGLNDTHDEAFSVTWSNLTIRYNVFRNIVWTGVIADASGGNPSYSNWDIYGNLWFDDNSWNAQSYSNSWGLIVFLGETAVTGYVHVYNNTIVNVNEGSGNNQCQASLMALLPSGSATIQVYNNVSSHNCGLGYPSAISGNTSDPFTGTLSWDYNSYFNGDSLSADTSAHKQTSTADPFVNSSLVTMAGYALGIDTAAGLSLASPYNMDMNGATRGSDGTWDRGATQLSTGTSAAPAPPQNLHVTAVQ